MLRETLTASCWLEHPHSSDSVVQYFDEEARGESVARGFGDGALVSCQSQYPNEIHRIPGPGLVPAGAARGYGQEFARCTRRLTTLPRQKK